jgi:hypothetical protein
MMVPYAGLGECPTAEPAKTSSRSPESRLIAAEQNGYGISGIDNSQILGSGAAIPK